MSDMILYGKEKKNYEYARAIFEGTCEISNYSAVYLKYEELKDFISISPYNKYFFCTPKDDDIIFGLVVKDNLKNDFFYADVVKTVVKVLVNIGIIDFEVKSDKFSERLKENLESIEIAVTNDVLNDDEFVKIYVENDVVVLGKFENDNLIFEICYNTLKKHFSHNGYTKIFDVYISPLKEDLLSDALIIGNNLKDAGIVTEINFNLEAYDEESLESDFLITFDEKDIKNYEVTLKDLKTKEVKKVSVDNLLDEVSFI